MSGDGIVEIQDIVQVEIVGGVPGAPGHDGAPGSAPQAYRHEQAMPLQVWTVQHDLGYSPAGVYVEDSAGTAYDIVPQYVDENSLILEFPGATDGFALFS